MVDLEIIESETERGEDDNFNVGYSSETSGEPRLMARKSGERPLVRIEKQGITTHSLSVEIIPSLLLAEKSIENIDKQSIIIVKDSKNILGQSQDQIERRVAQLNPQGNVVYLETGYDEEPLTLFSKGEKVSGLPINHVNIDDVNIFRLVTTMGHLKNKDETPVTRMFTNLADTRVNGKVNIMLMDPSSFQIWRRAWSTSENMHSRDPYFESAMTFRENQGNLDAGVVIGTIGSYVRLFRQNCRTLTPIHRIDNGYSDNLSIPFVLVPQEGTKLELKIKK